MAATLSTVVMAHPSREAMVEALLGELDGDAQVVWDRENHLWDTGRRSLLAHLDTDATHGLVIQDDVVPCRDLLATVEELIQHSGEHPVSLYAGMYRNLGSGASAAKRRIAAAIKQAERRARRGGSPWLAYEGPWWGPALVIPTAHICELVEWGDGWAKRRNYDARIGRWYIERKRLKCWYTMPSLVDHRPSDVNPSLLGNGVHDDTETGRVAHWFVGADVRPKVDWSKVPRR